MRAATVVQVLQDLFYCMFYFTCDRSLISLYDQHVQFTLNANDLWTWVVLTFATHKNFVIYTFTIKPKMPAVKFLRTANTAKTFGIGLAIMIR